MHRSSVFPLRKNNPQCATKVFVKDAEVWLPFVFKARAIVLLMAVFFVTVFGRILFIGKFVDFLCGCFGIYTAVALHIRDVSGSTWLYLFIFGMFRVLHGCSCSHSGCFEFYIVVSLHIRDVSGAKQL